MERTQLYTAPCTPVIFPHKSTNLPLDLRKRSFKTGDRFLQKPYLPEPTLKEDDLIEAVELLYRQATETYYADRRECRKRRPKVDTRDKVNRQRQAIAEELARSPNATMTEISKRLKASRNTIRKVSAELRIRGRLLPYTYNNEHPPQEVVALQRHILQEEDPYFSVQTLKQSHPTFSRRKITSELKKLGFHWKRMRRRALVPQERAPDHGFMLEVMSHLVQGHQREDVEILFADEMKFPLNQTPDYFWAQRGQTDQPEYNNRPDNLMLTAIALCSKRGFEAVQLFTEEVKSNDFLFFIQTAIRGLSKAKRFSILLDNATWHKSRLIRESIAWPFLYFNYPGQFRINLIENSFSGVRSLFRRRKVSETLVEEAEEIMRLFRDEENERRFEGYYYNHLRAMYLYFAEEH